MACSSAGDLWIVKPEKVDDVLRITNAKGHHLKHICLHTRRAVYRADELNSRYKLLLVAELVHSSRHNLA